MKDEAFMRKVAAYQTTMAVVRRLVIQGIISEEEYAYIDTIIARKHGLSLGSIFL